MLPVIALVGRPNVGKSTLFNRLTKSRDALVANYPGLTRDRQYGEGLLSGRRFMVVDTGGIGGEEQGVDAVAAAQSRLAIEEADAIFFVVDARAGLTAGDHAIAAHLRQLDRPVFLVVNKIDGVDPDAALADFYSLGFADLFPTTATHGRGVKQLMERFFAAFPADADIPTPQPGGDSIRIAVVGRPNVGKSTLVNRLLGEERVVVFDEPGTTRDSIYIDYERHGQRYTLIDTAGVRRRKNVKSTVEKFSIVKTLRAIDDTNVVVLLIDAHEGLVDQDMHLLGHALDAGRAMVVAVNKWDGVAPQQREWIKTELQRRLRFAEFADTHFISALHGTGVGNLYKSVQQAYRAATDTLGTSRLTRLLQDAVTEHAPPMVHGRRIKLRYAHAGGRNPPVIVIHGNQTDAVPEHYVRYLEKTFRRALNLHGTPLRIQLRSGENPYADRKRKLSSGHTGKGRRAATRAKK